MPKSLTTTRKRRAAAGPKAAPDMCRELAEGLLALYSAPDLAGFRQRALHVLPRLLPCAFASFHEVERGSVVRHLCEPPQYVEAADRLRVRDRSAVSHIGANAATVPGAGNEPSRTHGTADDVLVLAMQPTPATRLIFMVARVDETFSERERVTSELLRPHLLRAYELLVLLGRRRGSASGEADPTAASALLRRRFGLTDRESQLLYWLARGKSNREIGTISGISARTVDKHLQHVFDKMDVENRHAAIVQALHAIGAA